MLECKCCHNCEKRQYKCHYTCGEYKSFRQAKDAENAMIMAEKDREDRIVSHFIANVEKYKRRRKGKL